MIVLIDTDVLIDVATAREPFFETSSEILVYAEKRRFGAFIAWHSLSNLYYILSSNSSNRHVQLFIQDLLGFTQIPSTNTKDVKYALDLSFADFEDAMQVAAARACNADWIITRNVKHFKKSPITAIAPKEFLSRLM